jgi:hypothetical protein
MAKPQIKKKSGDAFLQRSNVRFQGTKYPTRHHGIGSSKFRYVDGKAKSIVNI